MQTVRLSTKPKRFINKASDKPILDIGHRLLSALCKDPKNSDLGLQWIAFQKKYGWAANQLLTTRTKFA